MKDMKSSVFFPQADLLVQALPFVHVETCFAPSSCHICTPQPSPLRRTRG